MGISNYIAALRKKIGNDLLLLPSVGAVIFDDQRRVLLQQAVDDGKWYAPGGAVDPGEDPADAVAREMLEETGLIVEPVRILNAYASCEFTYTNGHKCQYVGVTFICRVVGGALKIADDESIELRFFDTNALPPLPEYQRLRIEQAVADEPGTAFRFKGEWRRG